MDLLNFAQFINSCGYLGQTDSTFRLDLYYKKGQLLYCCRDCVTRGQIHRQARVAFPEFAEVNFRDSYRSRRRLALSSRATWRLQAYGW